MLQLGAMLLLSVTFPGRLPKPGWKKGLGVKVFAMPCQLEVRGKGAGEVGKWDARIPRHLRPKTS